MTVKYKGFKLFNSKTKTVKEYPYYKGWDNRDSEDKAIRKEMELTNQPRCDFGVVGFVK